MANNKKGCIPRSHPSHSADPPPQSAESGLPLLLRADMRINYILRERNRASGQISRLLPLPVDLPEDIISPLIYNCTDGFGIMRRSQHPPSSPTSHQSQLRCRRYCDAAGCGRSERLVSRPIHFVIIGTIGIEAVEFTC
jgi:hypothetical protein